MRERTHHGTGDHAVAVAHGQLVGLHASLVTRGAPVAGAVPVLALAVALALRHLGEVLHEEGAAVLRDHGQGRGDLHGVHVVLGLVALDHLAEQPEVLGLDGLLDLLREVVLAGLVDLVRGGHAHLLHGLTGGLLDGAQQVLLARRHEEDGLALAPGTAGAPDAVHVGLGVVGDVVVDHQGDPLDVQTAGCNVRGHEDVDLAVAQRVHGALAQVLWDVTVDRGGGVAAGLELVRDLLRGGLGAHEDDDAVVVLDLEHAGHGVQLVGAHDLHVALAGVGARGGLGLDRDLLGVPQVLLRDPADCLGHGRGEQRDLLLLRGLGQDLLHVLGEAHAQHLVGLVQHHVRDVVELQRALGEVVDHATGRAHDHLRAALEPGQLRAVGGAAVHGQDGEVLQVRGVRAERLGHLQRELTGGGQHEHAGAALRTVQVGELRELGQRGHRERGGLAGAGLGQAHDVPAAEQCGDGGGLDGRGVLVAHLVQGRQHTPVHAELGERGQLGLLGGRLRRLGGGAVDAARLGGGRCVLGRGGVVGDDLGLPGRARGGDGLGGRVVFGGGFSGHGRTSLGWNGVTDTGASGTSAEVLDRHAGAAKRWIEDMRPG